MTFPFNTTKKPRKATKVDGEWKIRYQKAHYKHYKENFPNIVKDGLYCPPDYPKVNTANGLTQMIEKFLNWSGYRCTRVNTMGRVVESKEKGIGGTFSSKKYIPSTTRRGTADLSSTVNGRSVMFEVKIGKDRPSEYQLKEQAKERRAGGVYEFVSTPNDFFSIFDTIVC